MAKKNTIFIIILVILAVVVFFSPNSELFSINRLTAENQLRQEYTTYWDDETDENIQFIDCPNFDECDGLGSAQDRARAYLDSVPRPRCATLSTSQPWKCSSYPPIYEGLLWDAQNSVDTPSGSGYVRVMGWNAYTSTLKTAFPFKGQEVVILTQGQDGCSSNVINSLAHNEIGVVKLEPHTFDTSVYDVEVNGIKTQELNVGDNGLDITLSCHKDGSTLYTGLIYYVGYKAQYECDLSENEVWINEQFAESFNIHDLEFIPTKFCHSTRPFILRDLSQGETPIRREEGIEVLNRGGTINVPEGDIVTVNYATYYVSGVLNPCGPNEANIKDAFGNWQCVSVIEPITIVQQCQVDEDCPISCGGITASCVDNICNYHGSCIIPPVSETSVWSLIQQLWNNFWNFIKSLFEVI